MPIGRGPQEQTGLAQIGRIHPPPFLLIPSGNNKASYQLTRTGEPLFEGTISKIEIQMVREVRNEALVFSLAPQNLASSCLLAL